MSTLSIHQFAEKVILISDGEHRIGKAAAIQLGLQGAFIIAGVDERNRPSNSALDELRSVGAMSSLVEADLGSSAGKKKLLDDAKAVFGRLDMFVNLIPLEPDAENDLSKYLSAEQSCLKYASSIMSDRPSPRMVDVFVSEMSVNTGFRRHLSDKGIFDHADKVSLELPGKVRHNIIAVNDPTPKSLFEDSDIFRPQGAVSPDDAARVVCFLLSSEAKALKGQVTFIS